MTSPEDVKGLQDLLARVTQASGADRELDFAIYQAAFNAQQVGGVSCVKGAWIPGYVYPHEAQPYTASSEAALALVGRCLPGWTVNLTTGDPTRVVMEARLPCATLVPHMDNDLGWALGVKARLPAYAATPALALIGALLSALIAQKETETLRGFKPL